MLVCFVYVIKLFGLLVNFLVCFSDKQFGSLYMSNYFCGLQMFTEYGPDFELDLQAGNKVNRNTNEYIEEVLQQVEGS